MVTLSCSVKNNISASLIITEKGSLADKRVERITGFDLDTGDQYRKLLEGLYKGVSLLKAYIDKNIDIDTVVLETNNQAVLTWLERGYAKPDYDEEFGVLHELIDEIPAKFTYAYNKDLIAKRYSKASCLTKVKLVGLEI